MKKAIYSILFILFSLPVCAQVIAIQNDKQTTLYIGIDNTITVAAEQCPYDSIQLVCKNGSLSKLSNNRYNVIVDSPGFAFIEIKKRTGQEYQLIDTRRYRVEYLPDPIAVYARRKGGEMALSEIDEGYVLIAKQVGLERSGKVKYVIDSFTLMVIRNDKLVFIRKQPGGVKMDDATLGFFKTLQVNDKLLFTSITCKGPDKRLLHLHALELLMTDKDGTVNEQDK